VGLRRRPRGPRHPSGESDMNDWLARKDSNLDFQGQNLTCYHCTTGEEECLTFPQCIGF
ncbi:MAG: hypothetical protein RL417_1490, partial [Pseudomonadota bacterium]